MKYKHPIYARFWVWVLLGLRARLELKETEPLDGIKYWLAMRLPVPSMKRDVEV